MNTAVVPSRSSTTTANATMQFEAQTTINTPADQVFALYADVANWPSWDPDVKSASVQGPFVSGAVGVVVPHGGPKSTLHFVQVVPNQSVRMECKLPLGKMQFDYALQSVGGATQVTHRTTFSGLLAPLWSRLIGASMKKTLPAALAGLKLRAESV